MEYRGGGAVGGREPPGSGQSVLARLKWLLGLGALELLGVSLWLDSESIAASGVMRLVLKKLPDGVLLIVIAFVLTLIVSGLLGWRSLQAEIARRRIVTGFPWILYGIHLACFGLFLVLSDALATQPDASEVAVAGIPVTGGAWIGSAVAAGVTWFISLLPVSLWTTAIVAGRAGLMAAVPVTLAAWLIGREARRMWTQLSRPTLDSAVFLLRSWGERPEQHVAASQLTLADFTVTIDSHCSGYEGVGAMAVFSCVYVWAMRSRLRFPQALVLIPLAMAASWFGNVLRIALLVEIGAKVSPDVARGGFHSQAGWIFLIFVSVLVMGVVSRFRSFNADLRESVRLRESAVAACLTPFLLWNFLGMLSVLTSANSQSELHYPVRLFACLVPLAYWRGVYARMLRVDGKTLAGFVAGGLAFAVWMALEFVLFPDPPAPLPPLTPWPDPWPQVWLACRIAGSCLAIPLIEELAFRGYLLRRFRSYQFESVRFSAVGWLGYFVSSLAFGALHGERWIAGTLAGLIFALAARQTNRLSSAVAAHATTNILLTAYVLATGDFARWH